MLSSLSWFIVAHITHTHTHASLVFRALVQITSKAKNIDNSTEKESRNETVLARTSSVNVDRPQNVSTP